MKKLWGIYRRDTGTLRWTFPTKDAAVARKRQHTGSRNMVVKRLPPPTFKCFRCGAPGATASWHVCADFNRRRYVCNTCDVGLNNAALRYMRDPDRKRKIKLYKKRMGVR